jgi:hypothetical protein
MLKLTLWRQEASNDLGGAPQYERRGGLCELIPEFQRVVFLYVALDILILPDIDLAPFRP